MSSARARILHGLGRAVRGIVWTVLFAVLAAGAAGLIAQASHAPGSPARAELTSEGDTELNARLDQATAQLQTISDDVDSLAEDAKTALEQISSADPAKLQDSLAAGSDQAAKIDPQAQALRNALANLPGTEPDATLRYSNDTLVRRAAVLAALDAAASLNAQWEQVARQANEVAQLISLIDGHDQVVLDATAKGRKHQYADATARLDDALAAVANIKAERDKLIAGTDPTVLDQWIERNRDFDVALKAVYDALVESGGNSRTTKVQLALIAERRALEQLPPDRRTIIVIVGEAARGGLTQAVLAIEDARGRIDDALAAAANQPGSSGEPASTESPIESPEPAESLGPGESGVPLP